MQQRFYPTQRRKDFQPCNPHRPEFQSRDTSKRIEAVRKAFVTKWCYAPFGYKKSEEDKHVPVIDENAVSIVKKIFYSKCQGYGYRKIGGILNRNGIERLTGSYSRALWRNIHRSRKKKYVSIE